MKIEYTLPLNQQVLSLMFFAALTLSRTQIAVAQSDTTFTFQVELQENGSPADGQFNFDFSVRDAGTSGTQISETIDLDGVSVVDGGFTVEFDFGPAAFDSSNRWLEIEVNGGTLTNMASTSPLRHSGSQQKQRSVRFAASRLVETRMRNLREKNQQH